MQTAPASSLSPSSYNPFAEPARNRTVLLELTGGETREVVILAVPVYKTTDDWGEDTYLPGVPSSRAHSGPMLCQLDDGRYFATLAAVRDHFHRAGKPVVSEVVS